MWTNHPGEQTKPKTHNRPRMNLRREIKRVWEFVGTMNEVLQDRDSSATDERRLCVVLDALDDAADHVNSVLDKLNTPDDSYGDAIQWWTRRTNVKRRAIKQKPKDLSERPDGKYLRPYFARMQVNPTVADAPPAWTWGKAGDIGSKFAAEWNASERAILLNPDFHVFRESRAYWIEKFSSLDPDAIDEVILSVYGSILCAQVVHVESPAIRRSGWTGEQQESLRSKVSLTASVLSLVGAETIIATRLGGRIGTYKKKVK